MATTTQDLVKGIDLTAVDPITRSHLNQLIDTGRLAVDKGMVIETEDEEGDPVVPDPNTVDEGITPTWWTRYLWKRVTATSVMLYIWDDNAASDPVYLKWIDINADIDDILAIAETAATNAADALSNSSIAMGNADTAVATANIAIDTANNALAIVEATVAPFLPGDIRTTLATTGYSTSADEGWLECNGTAVSKVVFAALYNALGGAASPFGVGETTFNLPDFRGRALYGVGTGEGLSAVTRGVTFGAEVAALTEANLPTHTHYFAVDGTSAIEFSPSISESYLDIVDDQARRILSPGIRYMDVVSDPETHLGSNFSIRNPGVGVRFLIKT